MGLLDSLKSLVGSSRPGEEGGDYRCIQCGEYHDRQYHTCPKCGGSWVAPVNDDE